MSKRTFIRPHVLPEAVIVEVCADGEVTLIEMPTREAYALAARINAAAERSEGYEQDFVQRFEAAKAARAGKPLLH